MSRFGKGYIPDPAGHLTTSFRALRGHLAASFPPETDLGPFSPPVMDQGNTSACTGHGTSGGIYTSCKTTGAPLAFVPSQRGIYVNARALDRDDVNVKLTDDGAMPNQVARSISEWGVRAMGPLPRDGRYSDCDPANINAEPTQDELELEAQHLLLGWYKITSHGKAREDDVCAALAHGWTVGEGTFVDTAFENWIAGDPPMGACNQNDPDGGGHWEFYLAYAPDGAGRKYRKRNSWSRDWGLNGDIWVTGAHLTQASDLIVFATNK